MYQIRYACWIKRDTYGAFHRIGIGPIIKLGQKEPRPIQTFTVRAALTRSIKTKIGLGQRNLLKFSKQINFFNTAKAERKAEEFYTLLNLYELKLKISLFRPPCSACRA